MPCCWCAARRWFWPICFCSRTSSGRCSSRSCPGTSPVPVGWTTAGCSAASCTCCARGCRWRDCPAEYGPPTTVYNRFNCWSRRGFWRAMLATLAEKGWITETASLDGTYVRAHHSAHGGKGGPRRRPLTRRAVADHRDPRPHRRPRPPRSHPPAPWQRQRRNGRSRRARRRARPPATPRGGPELRRRCAAARPAGQGHQAGLFQAAAAARALSATIRGATATAGASKPRSAA